MASTGQYKQKGCEAEEAAAAAAWADAKAKWQACENDCSVAYPFKIPRCVADIAEFLVASAKLTAAGVALAACWSSKRRADADALNAAVAAVQDDASRLQALSQQNA